ncbi:MAG: polysaccharide deacetylase family protein [Spirochaetales bacterium]|nr:polysaccharide deacetylase family protein [Spirochaetales bacterium]
MKQIYYTYPGFKAKALTLSYDDGTVSDYRLIETLNKYEIKTTVHLNSDLPRNDRIDSKEYNALYVGHEIACHTATHPTINRETLSTVAMEILQDRLALEKLTRKPVMGLSYPNGSTSKEIEALLPGLGIKYARTVNSTFSFEIPENFLSLNPTCHHNEKLLELTDKFINFNKRQYLKLFYLWGHSFEFDRDDNWSLLEQFCQKISRRDDIYYATNVELYDYLKAAKMLEFTVDGSYVYNPTALDIYLEVEGEKVLVEKATGLYL